VGGLKAFIQWILLPPGNVLVLGLAAVLLWRWRWGRVLALASVALLWVLTSPFFTSRLIQLVQWPEPPLTAAAARAADAQAIVVLGAGRKLYTPDGETVLDHNSLLRVREAARLARATELPVIATGGGERGQPVGRLMQQALAQEFKVTAPLAEVGSANTYENATLTYELLRPLGIERVILVTQAMHMPRAVRVFEHAGFEVIPAGTDYWAPNISLYAFTPQPRELSLSWLALHEIIGLWWYEWRYL
jgi:uncharacterized SAM-binding protein YcdF (DUF218 family)